jgi:hypothetical protein
VAGPDTNQPPLTEYNHAGAGTPGGRNTTAAQPDPTANANDAHDPEPQPEKHADGEADGRSAAGQGPAGNEHHTPPETARTDRTQATERAANAPRPTPHVPDATENTGARGNRERAA